jgi:hypothetical protein
MTLDMRARRAGDAVRASTREVNPMAHLAELQRESDLRTRARSAVAMTAAAVLVVTAAWLVATQPWRTTGIGPATPRPTGWTSPAGPVTVGSQLRPSLTATAPRDWFVVCDCSYVELTAFGSPVITVSPLTQVFDPATGRGIAAPADYMGWLRAHPWLSVISQRTVRVAGIEAPQLTVSVRQSATSADPAQPMLRFARVAGPEVMQPFALQSPGDVFTETVLTVHGQRLLVRAFGGTTTTPQDVQDVQQALAGFLASIRT